MNLLQKAFLVSLGILSLNSLLFAMFEDDEALPVAVTSCCNAFHHAEKTSSKLIRVASQELVFTQVYHETQVNEVLMYYAHRIAIDEEGVEIYAVLKQFYDEHYKAIRQAVVNDTDKFLAVRSKYRDVAGHVRYLTAQKALDEYIVFLRKNLIG